MPQQPEPEFGPSDEAESLPSQESTRASPWVVGPRSDSAVLADCSLLKMRVDSNSFWFLGVECAFKIISFER